MWVAWAHWLGIIRESEAFSMEPSYQILKSPATETRARFFKINPDQESKFLAFSSTLKTRSASFRNYVNLTTICGVYSIHCIICDVQGGLFHENVQMIKFTNIVCNQSISGDS
jgi:hypothetical protein